MRSIRRNIVSLNTRDIPYCLALIVAAGFLLPIKTHSLCLGLFILSCVIFGSWKQIKEWRNPIWLLPCIFFFVVLFGIFISSDKQSAWLYAERKLSMFFLPVAFILFPEKSRGRLNQILMAFVLGAFVAALYCLGSAIYSSITLQNPEYLFYHKLSNPVGISAIYFSVYCLFSFVILTLPEFRTVFDGRVRLFLLVFISCFLLLLSSKMMIFLWTAYTCGWLVGSRKEGKYKLYIAVIAALLLASAILFVPQIKNRISAELQTNSNVLHANSYDANTPFTGSSLRWALMKQALGVLKENEAWLIGVGTGDFQYFLNDKYRQSGMYTGSGSMDRGYLDYNPHNQYVEILLTTGALGLIVFIFWIWSGLRASIFSGNNLLTILLGIFICICISECFLNTNKGIVWFMFFYGLLLRGNTSLKEGQTHSQVNGNNKA